MPYDLRREKRNELMYIPYVEILKGVRFIIEFYLELMYF